MWYYVLSKQNAFEDYKFIIEEYKVLVHFLGTDPQREYYTRLNGKSRLCPFCSWFKWDVMLETFQYADASGLPFSGPIA